MNKLLNFMAEDGFPMFERPIEIDAIEKYTASRERLIELAAMQGVQLLERSAFGTRAGQDAGNLPTQASQSGPGFQLKKLLKDWLGITASPNCSCNAHARQMDEWGPDECERRLPEIVGWLEEQARARKLPFVRFAAEQAVKLAIRRARKAAAR